MLVAPDHVSEARRLRRFHLKFEINNQTRWSLNKENWIGGFCYCNWVKKNLKIDAFINKIEESLLNTSAHNCIPPAEAASVETTALSITGRPVVLVTKQHEGSLA